MLIRRGGVYVVSMLGGGSVEIGQVRITDGTDVALVDSNGALQVHNPANEIDSTNSTTSTLGSDAVFTGTGTDVLDVAAVTIQIDSSHDSATDGMSFEFSTDNSNWDRIHVFTYTAADGARVFQFAAHAQFFRFVYTNGGTGQTHFRAQTILHHVSPITSIHRLVNNTDPDRSATLHKSAIIAQAAGTGDFVPVQATAAGNLKMAVEEFSDGVDVGNGVVGSETLRVTVASDSTGQLIALGNVANDAADAGNPLKIGGRAQAMFAMAEQASADNDRVDQLFDRNGYGRMRGELNPASAPISDALSGDNEIVAAQGANTRIAVYGYMMIADGTVLARWESAASGTALTGRMSFQAREGLSSEPGSMPLFICAANQALNLELSAAVAVQGHVSYAVWDDA